MSTNAIITSWGANVAGREQMGMGVFMQAIQFFTACKQKGEIDELRIYISNDGDISATAGHMVVEGSAAQLTALAARDEYRAVIIKAAHVVHGFRTSQFATGDAVMARVEQLQTVRKELGI
jgi:hypothetical protein